MEKKQVGRPRTKPLSSLIYTRETAWDYASMLDTLPDPDRILSKLGLSADDAFEDIETDDHLTAVRNKRTGKLLAMEWDIEKGDASAKAVKEIKAVFENIDMRKFMRNVVRARAWGMSPIEVVWERFGLNYYPAELQQKPTRWFEFNDKNEIQFKSQASILAGEPVKPYKLLVPQNQPDYDNPYGIKLLSRSYWPITFKRNAWKWWNKGLERIALPIVYAKAAPNTSETEKSKIITWISEMMMNGIGVLPNTSEIDTMDIKANSGSHSDMFDKFSYDMDKAISKIWLGGTLTTEMGDVGSYSAAQTHESGEDALVNDDRFLVMDTANQLIKWIMYFNFPGPAPKFVLQKPYEPSKEQAERDKILSETGVTFKKEYFEDVYHIDPKHFEINANYSVKDADDEQKALPNPNKPEEDKKAFSAMFADIDQKNLEKGFDALSKENINPEMEKVLKPAIQIIKKANSFSEASANIAKAFPKMDSKDIESIIERLIFTSETIGRLSAIEENK